MTKNKTPKKSKPLKPRAASAKHRRHVKEPSVSRRQKLYMLGCVLVLFVTSLLWALWGTRVHQSNADQLVNTYLFDSAHTFQQATLPGQHSFLFKWPLLFLVKLCGSSNTAYTLATIFVVMLTVILFTYILYRINRRPLIFGTLCLCLASVLLLVPPAPYAGGMLPVNMAMLTTRNLEYVLYLGALTIFIRSHRFKSVGFWVAFVFMALLIASDKLFLSLSVGGALIGLISYSLAEGWNMVSFSVGWLSDNLIAFVGASLLLLLISSLHITHIIGGSTGPYGIIHSAHSLALGLVFGFLGLLTNFGANPAFDAATLRSIPGLAADRLFSVSGPGYLVNLAILSVGLFVCVCLLRHSLAYNKDKTVEIDDTPTELSIFLIWSSLAAGASFVITDHYYVVDARYLTIALFTVFICLATYLRNIKLNTMWLVRLNAVLLVVIVLATFGSRQMAQAQQKALDDTNSRNETIVSILAARKVDTLVGDYWRVIPTRQASNNTLHVTPLADCFTPRDVLSSKSWQPDLTTTGFAYLLSFDKSLTNYPSCTLDQVIATYGRPNKSSLVSGTLVNPKELLLFYDTGTRTSAPVTASKTPSTVLPVAIEELPNQGCAVPTVVQIVAHQDDDLLFMNPDLSHDIQAGRCIRTVYVTAGDGGGGSYYWLGREKGSEDAYSSMLGSDVAWVERIVQLSNGQLVTIANPRGNLKVSLVFLRLPDGNLKGQGFPQYHNMSLSGLEAGHFPALEATDKQSRYTSEQLISSMVELLATYKPTTVRTQSSLPGNNAHPDHSDHMAVGRLVQKAYGRYEAQQYENKIKIPVIFYTGYGIKDQPENVSGNDLTVKKKAFAAYTQHDKAACTPESPCWQTSNYKSYIPRQYQAVK